MSDPVVHVVDDDPAVRDSLGLMLQTAGFTVETFASGDAYLAASAPTEGTVLLLDIRMPGRDGLQVLEDVMARDPKARVVMVSGHGDIPIAVQAIRKGAREFIEKPFSARQLIALVRGLHADMERQSHPLDVLTPREREIALLLADGKPNKIVAHELSISPRTVETHRAHLMSKLGARSVAELVRLVVDAGD